MSETIEAQELESTAERRDDEGKHRFGATLIHNAENLLDSGESQSAQERREAAFAKRQQLQEFYEAQAQAQGQQHLFEDYVKRRVREDRLDDESCLAGGAWDGETREFLFVGLPYIISNGRFKSERERNSFLIKASGLVDGRYFDLPMGESEDSITLGEIAAVAMGAEQALRQSSGNIEGLESGLICDSYREAGRDLARDIAEMAQDGYSVSYESLHGQQSQETKSALGSIFLNHMIQNAAESHNFAQSAISVPTFIDLAKISESPGLTVSESGREGLAKIAKKAVGDFLENSSAISSVEPFLLGDNYQLAQRYLSDETGKKLESTVASRALLFDLNSSKFFEHYDMTPAILSGETMLPQQFTHSIEQYFDTLDDKKAQEVLAEGPAELRKLVVQEVVNPHVDNLIQFANTGEKFCALRLLGGVDPSTVDECYPQYEGVLSYFDGATAAEKTAVVRVARGLDEKQEHFGQQKADKSKYEYEIIRAFDKRAIGPSADLTASLMPRESIYRSAEHSPDLLKAIVTYGESLLSEMPTTLLKKGIDPSVTPTADWEDALGIQSHIFRRSLIKNLNAYRTDSLQPEDTRRIVMQSAFCAAAKSIVMDPEEEKNEDGMQKALDLAAEHAGDGIGTILEKQYIGGLTSNERTGADLASDLYGFPTSSAKARGGLLSYANLKQAKQICPRLESIEQSLSRITSIPGLTEEQQKMLLFSADMQLGEKTQRADGVIASDVLSEIVRPIITVSNRLGEELSIDSVEAILTIRPQAFSENLNNNIATFSQLSPEFLVRCDRAFDEVADLLSIDEPAVRHNIFSAYVSFRKNEEARAAEPSRFWGYEEEEYEGEYEEEEEEDSFIPLRSFALNHVMHMSDYSDDTKQKLAETLMTSPDGTKKVLTSELYKFASREKLIEARPILAGLGELIDIPEIYLKAVSEFDANEESYMSCGKDGAGLLVMATLEEFTSNITPEQTQEYLQRIHDEALQNKLVMEALITGQSGDCISCLSIDEIKQQVESVDLDEEIPSALLGVEDPKLTNALLRSIVPKYDDEGGETKEELLNYGLRRLASALFTDWNDDVDYVLVGGEPQPDSMIFAFNTLKQNRDCALAMLNEFDVGKAKELGIGFSEDEIASMFPEYADLLYMAFDEKYNADVPEKVLGAFSSVMLNVDAPTDPAELRRQIEESMMHECLMTLSDLPENKVQLIKDHPELRGYFACTEYLNGVQTEDLMEIYPEIAKYGNALHVDNVQFRALAINYAMEHPDSDAESFCHEVLLNADVDGYEFARMLIGIGGLDELKEARPEVYAQVKERVESLATMQQIWGNGDYVRSIQKGQPIDRRHWCCLKDIEQLPLPPEQLKALAVFNTIDGAENRWGFADAYALYGDKYPDLYQCREETGLTIELAWAHKRQRYDLMLSDAALEQAKLIVEQSELTGLYEGAIDEAMMGAIEYAGEAWSNRDAAREFLLQPSPTDKTKPRLAMLEGKGKFRREEVFTPQERGCIDYGYLYDVKDFIERYSENYAEFANINFGPDGKLNAHGRLMDYSTSLGNDRFTNGVNQMNILEALYCFIQQDADDWDVANADALKVREAFSEDNGGEAKTLATRTLRKDLEAILRSNDPGAKQDISILFDLLKRSGGAGPLVQMESLIRYAHGLSEHYDLLAEPSATLERRMSEEHWSNDTRSNFCSAAADLMDASPEIYRTFAELLADMPDGESFDGFAREIIPLYRAELSLLRQFDYYGDSIGNGTTTVKYDQQDLDSLKEKMHTLMLPFRGLDSELSPERAQKAIEIVRGKIFEEISGIFADKFGILPSAIPSEISKHDTRAIEDIALYNSYLNEPSREKTATMSYILALQLQNSGEGWRILREGNATPPAQLLDTEQARSVSEALKMSRGESPFTEENTGLEGRQLERFRVASQAEITSRHEGRTGALEARTETLLGALTMLADADFYQKPSDKDRFKLVDRYVREGNAGYLGIAAARLWSEFSQRPMDKKTTSQFEQLERSQQEKVDEISKAMQTYVETYRKELSLDGALTDADIVSTQIQRNLGFLRLQSELSQEVGRTDVSDSIRGVKQSTRIPNEVIEILNKIGENYHAGDRIQASESAIDDIRQLKVVYESDISSEESRQIESYLTEVSGQVAQLDGHYRSILGKFEKFKKQFRARLGEDEMMTMKVDQIDAAANLEQRKTSILTTVTTDFLTIMENMRACLSCKTQGCNNDTDLTFLEPYKFYAYSHDDVSGKSSVSDQIVHLIPSQGPNGTNLSFVMDRIYGQTGSDILISHIKAVYKKAKLLKRQFPSAKLGVFVPEGAIESAGSSLQAQDLIEELGIPKMRISTTTRNVTQPESGFGDHYVEYDITSSNDDTEPREAGERQIDGIEILF